MEPRDEDDDTLFLHHETLLLEEHVLQDDLKVQQKDAKQAIASKQSLVSHRALSDLLIRRLREVERELEVVEGVIALRFHEEWNKIIMFPPSKNEQ